MGLEEEGKEEMVVFVVLCDQVQGLDLKQYLMVVKRRKEKKNCHRLHWH